MMKSAQNPASCSTMRRPINVVVATTQDNPSTAKGNRSSWRQLAYTKMPAEAATNSDNSNQAIPGESSNPNIREIRRIMMKVPKAMAAAIRPRPNHLSPKPHFFARDRVSTATYATTFRKKGSAQGVNPRRGESSPKNTIPACSAYRLAATFNTRNQRAQHGDQRQAIVHGTASKAQTRNNS